MPIAALNKSCHPERSVRAFAFPPRRFAAGGRAVEGSAVRWSFAGVPASRDVPDPGEEGPSLWESRQIQKAQFLYIP